MLRNSGNVGTHQFRQVLHAAFSIAQSFRNENAGRMRQSFDNVGTNFRSSFNLWIHQNYLFGIKAK
jgi:hypothetical protein